MSAVDDSEQLIGLVRENEDIANHADGCDDETIAAAEHELGVSLPPSYRRVVAEFGTWDIAGQEFLGVYRTDAMGDRLLGSVKETLDARAGGLPHDLVVTMFDGMGGLVVLDTSAPDGDGEYPVLVWEPDGRDRADLERLGDDFGSYALGLVRRSVEAWRAQN